MPTAPRPGQLAPLIPNVAVLIGIYVVKSIWFAILAYHLGVAAVLYLDRRERSGTGKRATISTPVVGINLLIGLCTGVLLYLLWPMVGVPGDLGPRLSRMGLTSWAVFGTYYCLANPVLEELFWRRYLASPSIFPTLNDALFAGYHMLVLAPFMHWGWLMATFALLVCASCIWRYSIRYPRGLPVIILSHFLADLGIVLVGYLRTLPR